MKSSGESNPSGHHPHRKQMKLNLPLTEPGIVDSYEVLSVPVLGLAGPSLSWEQTRLLSEDLESLVLFDRVASPRELLHRLESTIQVILDVDSVRLLPVGIPSGEFWRDVEPASLAIPGERLELLARTRGEVLYVRDYGRLAPRHGGRVRSGSGLYMSVGDDEAKWWAVVEARDGTPNGFPPEKVALAVFLARHLQILLSAAVRLQSMIFLDYLTGLYNRPYFEDQLAKHIVIARRRHRGVALSIVDIDDFKRFNTRYGYSGGDQALRTVGSRLRSAIRATDTLSRYGGEEFAIVHGTPVSADELRFIAERLRVSVASHPVPITSMEGESVDVRITVSIGVALLPDEALTSERIWTASNRMLLEAKRSGKNRVCFTESGD
jgi:diguanylate cyclase (GGDEF)-like protein